MNGSQKSVNARPHPGPLPRGEDETLAPLQKALGHWLNPTSETITLSTAYNTPNFYESCPI
jgi:hypothetical protein